MTEAAENAILSAYKLATGAAVNIAPSKAADTSEHERALADVHTALQDYRSARESLDFHRGLAKHGMANALASALHAESSAFARLERAQKACDELQPPPTPKPTVAPTPPPVPEKVAATAHAVEKPAATTPPTRRYLTQFREGLEEVNRLGIFRYREKYGLSSPYSDAN